jgi:hypothetical protein
MTNKVHYDSIKTHLAQVKTVPVYELFLNGTQQYKECWEGGMEAGGSSLHLNTEILYFKNQDQGVIANYNLTKFQLVTKDAKSGILIAGRALLDAATSVIKKQAKKILSLMRLAEESKIVKKVGAAHEYPSGFTELDLRNFILFQLTNWDMFYCSTADEYPTSTNKKVSTDVTLNGAVNEDSVPEEANDDKSSPTQVGWSQTQGGIEDEDELIDPVEEELDIPAISNSTRCSHASSAVIGVITYVSNKEVLPTLMNS